MELTLNSKQRKVRQKVEQDFSWYDSKTKKMLRGRGGRMEFVYDPSQKRSIPRIVDHEEAVNGNDYDDIKKWVKENSDKYNFSIESDDGRNVTISIDTKHFNDIRENLYQHNIVLDY